MAEQNVKVLKKDIKRLQNVMKTRAKGKRQYQIADALEESLLKKFPPGTRIDVEVKDEETGVVKMTAFILNDNFAEANVSWKIAGVKRLEFKKATKAQLAANVGK